MQLERFKKFWNKSGGKGDQKRNKDNPRIMLEYSEMSWRFANTCCHSGSGKSLLI